MSDLIIIRADIAAVVLAGGEGRRMGGVDKGLMDIAGRPTAAWALERLGPQAAQLMINANRSLDDYRRLTGHVVSDEPGNTDEPFAGPLAGFLAAMNATTAAWLLTLPCDAPFAPPDLARRFADILMREKTRIAVAEAGGRLQPAHAMMATDLRTDLAQALAAGERKVMRWVQKHPYSVVNFDDHPDAFINMNTPEELAAQDRHIREEQTS